VWANSLDWFGIISFVLILCIFYNVRRRIEVYVICCTAVIALFVLFTWDEIASANGAPEWWILTFGLVLYAFGLLVIRIMLQRSVSLHLLEKLNGKGEQEHENMREEIAERLRDMQQFRLISTRQVDVYHLTHFGLFVASVVTFLYFVLRIQR
jgi:hypothetical protein